MKTSLAISTLALVASTQAMALIGPNPGREAHKACLTITEDGADGMYAGNCDETNNNKRAGKTILENGCAQGQAALTTFEIKLPACRDPRVVQL